MSYPGDQVTAPPDQWWRYQSGQHAYAPVQAGFDDEPYELTPASGRYAASARSGQARNAGTEYAPPASRGAVPPPGSGEVPPAGEGQARRAGTGYVAPPSNAYAPPTSRRDAAQPDTGERPRLREGRAQHGGTGYAPQPGSEPAPLPGSGHAPGPRTGNAPQPGNGYAPQPRTGNAPQPGDGYQAARAGRPGGGIATAAARTGQSRRDPARGYPPPPGAPGPLYPQHEFSAWNEPAAAAPGASGELPCSAPTWSDAGGAFNPGGAGVALAERGGDDPAGISHDDVAAWAASFADEQAAAAGERFPLAADPGPDDNAAARPEPDAGLLTESAVTGAAGAAGRTRSAATRARKTTRRKVRARRRVVVAGVCLPAVAVVAIMALQHPNGHAPAISPGSRAPAAVSSVSHPSPSLGPWQHIGRRALDPAPLTLSQLFPAQFAVGSASYLRTAQLGSTDCSHAVFGKKLQAAVRKYGCSQVMRASYLDQAQKLMGTIGVVNLTSSATASKTGKVTGSSQFIAQLTAAAGPTHSLTKGTGLEEAEVKGHYLILTWAEFTTHRAPKTAAQKAQLKAFSAALIGQTANVSLTSRMVTGQPRFP